MKLQKKGVMMIKKIKTTALILAAIFALVYLNPIYSSEKEDDIEKHMRLFSDAFMLIRENYVEEITARDLIYGAMKGMMNSLDSYSQFMEPEVTELVKADTRGEFGGLGIRITTRDDYVTVVTPLPDTPAFRIGILPEDKIAKIEEESAKGITLRDAVKKLRGPPGSTVTISIIREGEEELLNFTITREIIVPQKVYKDILPGNIGYVRLTEFTEDAPLELSKALEELLKVEVGGLILDLRNNPGGLLSVAVEIANLFLEKGQLIVYTSGRRADQNRRFYAKSNPVAGDIPLVVLINKGSASGSEIVAGSIKDIGRGIIIGETSFGKASVQSIIDLQDESALRLTTARYYTPSGAAIHDKGITPDIIVILTADERKKIAEQQLRIYHKHKEEKEPIEEAEEIIDPQLARAIDVLVARQIFLRNEKQENTE